MLCIMCSTRSCVGWAIVLADSMCVGWAIMLAD